MSNPHITYIQRLHGVFEKEFMNIHKEAPANKRGRVLPHIQAMYRRWFYSTLIEDTPLSPANVFEVINRYHNMPSQAYPVAGKRGKSRFTGIDITLVDHTLDNHPIVADLRKFIAHSTPHIDLTEDEALTHKQGADIGQTLSLNDTAYAHYLCEVAIRMRLIAKVPSIGITRFKPSAEAVAKLTSTPDRDIFHDIVDTAVTIASKGMQMISILPETLFNPAYVRSLLHAPITTDEIFSRIYEVLGYDMEEIINLTSELGDPDEMDGIDMDLLAGTFMSGVYLDKFFFTPFGHFLKLIRPLYILPYDIEGEYLDFLSASDDIADSDIAFYAPCSSYSLTDLGLEFFEVSKTEENYFEAQEILSFEQMKDTIFSSDDALEVFLLVGRHLSSFGEDEECIPDEIYTFRVRDWGDKTMWAHIQMPDDATLDNLFMEIAECLVIDDDTGYVIFHDKTENRFAEYAPVSPIPKRGKKPFSSKSTQEELRNLDFTHQPHMLMLISKDNTNYDEIKPTPSRIEIELLHKKPPANGEEYPRISRESKALEEYRLSHMSSWLDFDDFDD